MRIKRNILAMGLVLALTLVLGSAALAASTSTIDFEGLPAGTIVSSLSAGNGISGVDAGGSVSVFGFRPKLAGNTAVIFDANCGGSPATCTSNRQDADLYYPDQDNILILAENLTDGNMDGLVDDPNDADDAGMIFSFDFSSWGTGEVTVVSMDVMDVELAEGEGGAEITLYAGGNLISTVNIPDTGNNGLAIVPVGVSGVDYMEVTLNGSGAIDNIEIKTEDEPPGGGQGCTPGYWKQSQHFDSWVGYNTTDDYEAVFGVDASFNKDLLGALKQGGGGEKALGRHATAALLNAANPDVSYGFTQADIIALVQGAYASGDFEGVKNIFEFQNELGCPIN